MAGTAVLYTRESRSGDRPCRPPCLLGSSHELVEGHEARGRYSWPSLNDPAVKPIIKAIKNQATGNGKGKASGKEAKS